MALRSYDFQVLKLLSQSLIGCCNTVCQSGRMRLEYLYVQWFKAFDYMGDSQLFEDQSFVMKLRVLGLVRVDVFFFK